MANITLDVLAQQDSSTSQAILQAYAGDVAFSKLAELKTGEILARDNEDGDKLAVGIKFAVDKGVLPATVDLEETAMVDVMGKSADEVADAIIEKLGDATSKGCVMTLQGLSGTGKGTTCAKLKEKLPNAQTWSNGNLFRSYTLLAVTYAEQNGVALEDTLTPELLASFGEMLSFDQFDGKFDVKIEGLGLKYFVSEVEKTVLKESKVGSKIPTIASVTQGEVIKFVQVALDKLAAAGFNVLVEGREQTLNYIRTPHRFELTLKDPNIVGMRQAALQMGGKAFETVKGMESPPAEAIKDALDKALAEISEAATTK